MTPLNSSDADGRYEASEQSITGLGTALAKLLHTYGNPTDSKSHAEIATRIEIAVARKDKDALLRELSNFGNARNNATGQQMQVLEMYCDRESRALSEKLLTLDAIPWGELASALAISLMPDTAMATVPSLQPIVVMRSKEDLANTEDFIRDFVLHNDALTSAAMEFLVDKARSERGPWSAAKGHVLGVTQQEGKITIRQRNGESYYQLS